MNVIDADVRQQAQRMLTHLEAARPGAVAQLHADALVELEYWPDVQVRRVPDIATDDRCSVAGGYVHTTQPPTLTVTTSLSRRRQQFTVLHELGHHLQKNDAHLALAVRRQRANTEAFEDAACDLFASLVLIPDDILPVRPDGRSPSAGDVVDVFNRTNASRAACCVRIASQLDTPGAVTVLDEHGSVVFATGHGQVFPPARNTSQAGTPLVAAALRRRGNVQVDDSYIQYRTGTRSDPLYGDAAWAGDYLITVTVLDRASWKSFAPPRTDPRRFVPRFWTCALCHAEFIPDGACDRCGEPRCPSGHCGCTAAAERQCQRCFQVLAPARFSSRTSTVCRACNEED